MFGHCQGHSFETKSLTKHVSFRRQGMFRRYLGTGGPELKPPEFEVPVAVPLSCSKPRGPGSLKANVGFGSENVTLVLVVILLLQWCGSHVKIYFLGIFFFCPEVPFFVLQRN